MEAWLCTCTSMFDEFSIHLLCPETGGRLPTLSPPTITLHPTHATVDLGGSAVLECRAEGEGLVYDWYKDGKQFRHDRRHGKLIFDRMRPEDVGEYYCEVVNDGGRIKSSPAKLTVCESN